MRKGPEPPVSDCVHIFLDESGNLDFSARGTRYFVLTSVSMARPFAMYEALDAYKYDCLEYGLDNERFHCSADNRHVRGKVFGIIGAHLAEMSVHSLIAEKRAARASLSSDGRLYAEMLSALIGRVLSGTTESRARDVIVIADVVPLRSRRRAIEKSVRSALSKVLPNRPIFRILHHDSRAHYGLQVVDYLCWAVFRKYERGDSGYFDKIRPAMLDEIANLEDLAARRT